MLLMTDNDNYIFCRVKAANLQISALSETCAEMYFNNFIKSQETNQETYIVYSNYFPHMNTLDFNPRILLV